MYFRLATLLLTFSLTVDRANLSQLFGEDLRAENCPLNQNFQNLVEWFFERTTHIEFTEILESSAFSSTIVQRLMKTPTSLVQTLSSNLSSEELNHFPDMKNYRTAHNVHSINYTIRQIFNRTIPQMAYGKRQHQEEEPQSAALMFTDSLTKFDEYLTGNSRRPFAHPNVHIIILVSDPEMDVDGGGNSLAAHIMRTLWKDFWIVDAFVVFLCQSEEIVGYYDPFEPPIDNDQAEQQEHWGAMVWTTLSDINRNRGWFSRRAEQFNNYPLLVSLFWRFPTLIYMNELPALFVNSYVAAALRTHGGGYGGYDALLMANLAAATNLNPVLRDSGNFGFAYPNGTFDGALGDVLDEVVDISFTSRFVEMYGTMQVDFVLPVFSDQICVIVPSGEEIHSWTAIFRAFRIEVWLTIVFGNVISFCVWLGIRRILFKRSEDNGELVLYMLSTMLTIPIKLPRLVPERLLLGTCILANVIIIGTFQGLLTRSFSTIVYKPDIDTLIDLDASGLPISSSSPNLANLFGSDDSPTLVSLRSKLKITNNPNYYPLKSAALDRDVCGVERLTDATSLIQAFYTSPNGREQIHIVRECVRYYHLGYLIKRNSPYRDVFSRILKRFNEAGFLQIWYTHTRDVLLQRYRKVPPMHPKAVSSFTIHDLQIAFYALGTGLSLAFIMFLVEISGLIHCQKSGD